ncbi:MAG: hypothetical protein H6Q41_1876 [Deltaproteobacteria bacterium]|nr:hypothetical protein [Deltaproteobacteria bacterium]
MLNVKYLLESRRERRGPPMGRLGKKDVHRISLFNSVERKEERSGLDQTVVD